MKYFRIEALVDDQAETIFIEALKFSKKRIRKILKEVHPEWNIKTIKSVDTLSDKERKK
tara:strand:- start:1395 stop:1571 length:177 start_codon:yes stop_codon:yes gene_type:complete